MSRVLSALLALGGMAFVIIQIFLGQWQGRFADDLGPWQAAALCALGAGVLAAHAGGRFDRWARPFLVVSAWAAVGIGVGNGQSAATALALGALGLAVAGLSGPGLSRWVGQPGALAALALAGGGVLSGWVNSGGDVQIFELSPATAVGVAVGVVATFTARPRWGVMALVSSSGHSGAVARRVLIGLLAAPIACVAAVTWTGAVYGAAAVLPVTVALLVALSGVGAAVVVGILGTAEAHGERAVRSERALGESVADQRPLVSALHADLRPQPVPAAGWELAWRHDPAFGEVAGDWFDVVPGPGSDKTRSSYLILLDVAGHGASSALVASWCKHQVQAAIAKGASAGDALASLESLLYAAEQVATAVVVEIDPSGHCTVASAGHPPVLVWRRGKLTELAATAPPLGVGTAGFPVHHHTMGAGETLVVVSDGILEAGISSSGGEWGLASLRDTVRDRAPESVSDLAEAVRDAALHHASGQFADDATVAVLRRR